MTMLELAKLVARRLRDSSGVFCQALVIVAHWFCASVCATVRIGSVSHCNYCAAVARRCASGNPPYPPARACARSHAGRVAASARFLVRGENEMNDEANDRREGYEDGMAGKMTAQRSSDYFDGLVDGSFDRRMLDVVAAGGGSFAERNYVAEWKRRHTMPEVAA